MVFEARLTSENPRNLRLRLFSLLPPAFAQRSVERVRFQVGSLRYFLIMADETALMIMAYAKNDQEDLTPEQRKAVLQLLKEIDDDEE